MQFYVKKNVAVIVSTVATEWPTRVAFNGLCNREFKFAWRSKAIFCIIAVLIKTERVCITVVL